MKCCRLLITFESKSFLEKKTQLGKYTKPIHHPTLSDPEWITDCWKKTWIQKGEQIIEQQTTTRKTNLPSLLLSEVPSTPTQVNFHGNFPSVPRRFSLNLNTFRLSHRIYSIEQNVITFLRKLIPKSSILITKDQSIWYHFRNCEFWATENLNKKLIKTFPFQSSSKEQLSFPSF